MSTDHRTILSPEHDPRPETGGEIKLGVKNRLHTMEVAVSELRRAVESIVDERPATEEQVKETKPFFAGYSHEKSAVNETPEKLKEISVEDARDNVKRVWSSN